MYLYYINRIYNCNCFKKSLLIFYEIQHVCKITFFAARSHHVGPAPQPVSNRQTAMSLVQSVHTSRRRRGSAGDAHSSESHLNFPV